MSHAPFFKSVQKVAYKYVDGPSENDDNDNVGNNEQYINNQIETINRQNQRSLGAIPDYINKSSHDNVIGNLRHGNINQPEPKRKVQSDPYHKYDPYYEYLRKIGSFADNSRTRVNTRTYSINSNARSFTPQIVTKDRMSLPINALTYNRVTESIGVNTTTKNILSIYSPEHNVQKGDQITLSGVTGQTVSIKSIYNDINGNSQNAVIFTNYSISVAFKCNFDTIINDPITGLPTSNIDTSMSFDPSFRVGAGINYNDLKSYDTSDMYVTLSGFDISAIGVPFVGNIPINYLNSTHRIYLTNPDFKVVNGVTVYSPDTLINVPNSDGIVTKITGFYILLQVPFLGNTITTTNSSSSSGALQTNTIDPMIINMTFNYIGGIPINTINAHYPVDNNNIKGSHEVYSVTSDTINVVINKQPHYTDLTVDKLSEVNIPFGGSDLEISTISSVSRGFSSPNSYSIELPNTISNVVMVKLTSITIPNTAKVFTNVIGSQNNKIYWQNQDDGDNIYSASINPGNYAPTELQTAIQSAILSVPKKYATNTNQNTNYTNRTAMAVSIDIPTNSVTFSAFKEAVLRKPIQDISPPIPTIGDGTGSYILTISQSNHGLLPGDTVTFAGFVATEGIPASILNAIQTVVSVPNSNTYTIQVSDFNLSSGSRTASGGGFAAKALVPSAFRLLFNYPDSIGKELGFRKVGQESAVTLYGTTVSNYDPYDGEVVTQDVDGNKFVTDSSGNISPLVPNSLKLDGHDYILMVIKNFDNIINISNINLPSYFAKINLRGLPGTVTYDDFICPPLMFYEPIEISKLDISFYTPNGTLYDFDGIDHNFMLEITNLEYVPIDTGIVSKLAMF